MPCARTYNQRTNHPLAPVSCRILYSSQGYSHPFTSVRFVAPVRQDKALARASRRISITVYIKYILSMRMNEDIFFILMTTCSRLSIHMRARVSDKDLHALRKFFDRRCGGGCGRRRVPCRAQNRVYEHRLLRSLAV